MADKPIRMPKPGEMIMFDHIAGKVYITTFTTPGTAGGEPPK